MGKARRGRNLKKTQNWKGNCPACKRTGVKLLWDKVIEGGNTIKVCKICGNK